MNILKSRIFKTLAIVTVLITGMATTTFNPDSNYFEIAKNIEIFTNAYKEVNTHYVDELDPAKLMRTGLDAMFESLDPYTNYISEGQIEGYRFMTEGKYHGIGADVKIIDDFPTVLAPYKNAPADKAGLKAGDQIIKIDGQETEGRDNEEIHTFMEGYPGTELKLTIKRPGEKKPLEISLMRDEINVNNVPYSGMVSEDVGYVALSTFTRNAGRNVGAAIKDLKVEQPDLKGVILDLRGNGGGLLAEAVNLVNLFVPKGEMIVSTRGKIKDRDQAFKTLNMPIDTDVPVVVLINRNSASASEIVSGAIQDLDRGVLIGQRSYGKGLVQNYKEVGYNARVKMTTAKYYIPSGRCIQSVEYVEGEPADIPDNERDKFKTRNGRTVLDGGGVKPDIVMASDESELIETLEENHLIFKYATQWVVDNPGVPSVENFEFTEWDNFIKFLEKKNFDFDTESEKLLEQLAEQSTEDGYLSQADVRALEAKVNDAKKKDLNDHKEAVSDLIEKEIISRFYYEKGRVQVGLRNDKEIKKAVELFGDPAKYTKILKG